MIIERQLKWAGKLFILCGMIFCITGGNFFLKAQSATGIHEIQKDHYTVERVLTTENGLPANGINEIIQDSKGYIWAATYNGLVRYDGNRPVIFNRSNIPELRTNRFLDVYEASDGIIWAGLESSSMIVIDGDSTHVFIVDEEIIEPNSHLYQIHLDENGKAWIATNRGLITFEDGRFFEKPDLPRQAVHFITEFQSRVYVVFDEYVYSFSMDGTDARMLIELKNDRIIHGSYEVRDFESVVRLLRVIVEDDHILLSHEAGIVKLMDDDYRVLLHRESVGHSVLFGVKKVDDYHLVTGSHGLLKIHDLYEGSTHIEQFTDLRAGEVIKDHEGSYWLATSAHGIYQFVNTPVYQGNTFDVISEVAVLATLFSDDGSLWVGTNCEGLYQFTDDSYRQYTYEDGIGNECVWSVMEQQNGTLWAGTWGGNGIYYRETGSAGFEPFIADVMDEVVAVLAIFEDSSDNVWFASFNHGVFMFDGETTRPVTMENGRRITAARMFYEDDGELYLTSDESIFVIRDGVIQNADFTEGIDFYNSRVIQEDPHGRLWIGSYGDGILVRNQDGSVKRLSNLHGLQDNTVSQIEFDKDNNAWIGGNSGVVFIAADELDRFFSGQQERLRSSAFGVSEGLRIRETTGGFMPSSQMNSEGELFIPTVQGLAKIDTGKMLINRNEPNVIIESVEVAGEQIRAEQFSSLPHDAQRIYFNFTALSYKNSDRVMFEYILEGFDANWQSITNTRQITYTTIPPGSYTLRVRAYNNDGFGDVEGVALAFSVPPPFWQTVWFYLLMILLVVLFAVGIYNYRLRKIQSNNLELHKKVDERTEELQKLIEEKDRLHSILAHDLRNPFAAIIGYIDLLRVEFEEKGNDQEREMMERLLESGRNTLDLLENLLQWSGADQNGLEANKEPQIIQELIRQAVLMTEAQANFKQVKVKFNPDGKYQIFADRNMMLTVLRNLISNGIKFSGNNSEIVITTEEKGDDVTVSVTDNGVGIPEEDLPDIFNPTTKKHKVGTQGEQGIGLGLVLCKDFIEKHNGKIWAESTPGKGSSFSFSLKKYPVR